MMSNLLNFIRMICRRLTMPADIGFYRWLELAVKLAETRLPCLYAGYIAPCNQKNDCMLFIRE